MTRAFAPERHRRSIRLRGYDYSLAGAYFVTLCTHDRACLLGDVVAGKMQVNEAGYIVVEEWLKTAQVRTAVDLDQFMVMPNHFHGVIVLTETGRRDVTRYAPPPATSNRMGAISPESGSLGAIIRSFKSAVTKRINELRDTPGAPVWQRSFHERIVRDEASMDRIRQYIIDNPTNWATDRENPSNTGA